MFEPATAHAPAAIKRQLVRASASASAAIRSVDPRASILHPEPGIHVAGDPARPESAVGAEAYRRGMFEAWDMIGGHVAPELGGSPDQLDLIGVNYYPHNQWSDGGRRIAPGDALHRPFEDLLMEIWRRYRRPILVAETGAEGDEGVG